MHTEVHTLSAANNRRRKATGRFYIVLAAFAAVIVIGVIVGILALSGAFKGSDAPASAGVTASPPSDEGQSGSSDLSQFAVLPEGFDEDTTPIDPSEQIKVNDLSVTPNLPSEWRNILLIGNDALGGVGWGRADALMIAAVNTQTGVIRLISIQRDTIVDIPGKGINRINAALQYGGPDLMMKTVNLYFGMNITEYVAASFSSFPIAVERLGGITMDITEAEWKAIEPLVGNAVWWDTMVSGKPMPDLDNTLEPPHAGVVKLTGRQALAFARIRIDSDFRRSERQRKVIMAIVEEVKHADITTLTAIASELEPYIETNLTVIDVVTIAIPVLANGAKIFDGVRLPVNDTFIMEKRRMEEGGNLVEALWDVDFEANTRYLHDLIFGS